MTAERMTDFERRLAAILRAHADRPGLTRPAEVVVADVIAGPRHRRAWFVPAGLAAVVVLIAAGVAGIRALDGMAARPADATVGGLTYAITFVPDLSFGADDITPHGTVSSTEEHLFVESTAYAIRGVDPELALVVPLRPGLLDGSSPPGDWALLTRGPVPGQLCRYYDPESEQLPTVCRGEQSP